MITIKIDFIWFYRLLGKAMPQIPPVLDQSEFDGQPRLRSLPRHDEKTVVIKSMEYCFAYSI